MEPAHPPDGGLNTATAAHFRIFFEALPGAVVAIQPKDSGFTVIAATDDYLRAGGIKRGDLIGRDLFEVFPDNPQNSEAAGRNSLRASLRRVAATGVPDRLPLQRYDVEIPAARGGGFEERYWSVVNTPIPDAHGNVAYILHAATDVTETIRVERRERAVASALQNSESRFHQLAEVIALGIMIGSRDGSVSYINPTLQSLLGYSQEEVSGGRLRWNEITPAEYSQLDVEALRQLDQTGRCAPYEKVCVSRDGRWIPVLVAASVLDLLNGAAETVSFILDLTERKQTEREAFLIRLEEATRSLSEPEHIIGMGLRLLGEQCGFDRCAYCSFEDDGETFSVLQDYTKAGVPSMSGRYSLSMFGPDCAERVRAGHAATEDDIEANPRAADVLPNYRAAGIRACIGVPLFKTGRLVSGLAVHQQSPRRWRNEEVELVTMVAARLWEAIERARTMKDLLESEQRLRMAQQAGRIGTFEWLMKEDRVIWTQAQEALYGVTGGVFEGRLEDWSKRVAAEDKQRVMDWIRECLAAKHQECSYEFRAMLPDGTKRWLRAQAQFFYSDTGEPLRMLGVNIDIDDSKKAEAHRLQQWQAFDLALSHIPDFVYVFDLEGRFTYVNRALLQLWGKTLDEARGKNFFDLEYPHDLAARLQRQVQEVIDTREPVRDQTLYTSPAGETGHYEYIFVPVVSEEGKVEGVAGSTRDTTDRNRIERTIEEDRLRWMDLLRHAPAAIAVLRGPDHRFEWVNTEYERVAARPAAELVGKTVLEALPEVESQIYIELLNGVYRTGEPFAGNGSLIQLNSGSAGLRDIYLNFVYLPTRNAKGQIDGIFFHGSEVTDMVMVRRRVEESERRFRTLVDSAIDHAIIGMDAERRVTNWNSGAERLLGFTEAEILGETGDIIFTPEDRAAKAPEKEMATAQKNGSASDERWHLRKNGTQFWGSGTMTPVRTADGTISGFVKVFQDRSREWAAREALGESEERFRQLANSMPQIVWTARPDGEIDYLNERWYEFSGDGTAREGPGWAPLLHPEDAERTLATWRRSVETGEPFQIETRFRDYREDRWRWFIGRALAVRDSANRVVKWFGTCTDIDEQKAAQQAVLHAQKLESIGLLAGGIAHDFNNLLVGIMGGASFAVETVSASHPAHPLLKGVVQASEKAAHLTRQMLAYAGKGRFFIEAVDLSKTVKETAQLVTASIPRSVEVQMELHSNLPTVQTDAGQMQQIVMNLLINAAEAAGEKGPGLVVVRTLPQDIAAGSSRRDIFGDTVAPGHYAALEVQDTGPGIAVATLAKIFDPFFTTKFTGRGLGLAAVLGIVRSHQGAIEVDTEAGKGSLFRVLFPARNATNIPKPPAFEEKPAARGSETVLVIDDEPVVRNLAEAALSNFGYGAIVCESGRAGLEHIRHDPSVALVLLDMSMPGMSGREVLEGLKSIRSELPVVICSGYSEDEIYQHFSGLDMAGVLQKPFTTAGMLAKVREVLDGVRPK